MQVEAGMLGEPLVYVLVLVGAVVVQNHVDLKPLGNLAVDRPQELQELAMAMARQALADDLAAEHVQRWCAG